MCIRRGNLSTSTEKDKMATCIGDQAIGIILANLFAIPIWAIKPRYLQKDDFFVDIVLMYPSAKDVAISRRDRNCLINARLRFATNKNCRILATFHRIAKGFQDATIALPSCGAFLESGIQ